MRNWNLETWLKVVVIPLLITFFGAIIGSYFGSQIAINQTFKINHGGDMQLKAGDGGSHGNGGDLLIGPGSYRAGDAVQN
jgi:hypothetical protein